jgi:hypothetical protein
MALTAAIDLTVKKPDFKSMKSEIRELTVQAQQAVMQFGEFSPEAIKAEKALAQARDRMEDFNDRVKAVNPDKFAQVNTVVQGVARGFQAAQGAMALFGTQSEELEKTMVKLQGAMALAEGLEGLGKIQQQFTAIFTNVVSGAKKAFAAIKAGIGSTGIGLLVVALGSIVAYWDEIKEAVSGVSDEQKELLKNTQKTAEANEKSYDNISKSENILKAQGKTEEEILKLKINAAKVSIQNLKAQLTTQENVRQSQIDTAKRNRDILQGMIRFVMFPLSLLLKGIDEAGRALGQNFGLEEGFSKGIAEMVFDPEEVKQESDKAIQASKDALLKLENDVAGYELAIKDIRKKGREDKEKSDKEAEQKEKERIAKLEALKDAEVQSDRARRLAQAKTDKEALKIKYDNERAAIKDAYFKQLIDAKGNEEAIKLIKAKYQSDLTTAKLNFDKQQAEADKKAFDKMVETETKNAEVITDISKKSSDDRIKHENAVQQNKDALYKASVDLANSIIALAGEQSKTGKALALSVIAADTAMAISGALSITQKPSPDNIATGGLAGAAKYIGLAAMILSNAKKARDILKSGQASSPSPLQLSGGGFSQMSAPQVSSTLPQVNGFEQRVFVTEGDISRTQARVGNTKRVSVVK